MSRLSFSSCTQWALSAIIVCVSTRTDAATSYALIPATITLTGSHAGQQLLVESVADGLFTGDNSSEAKFTSSDPAIATVDENGVVQPAKDGNVTITATVDGQSSTTSVSVTGMQRDVPRSFRNDVQPVLAKMGYPLMRFFHNGSPRAHWRRETTTRSLLS
jgi:hypothetical protein